MQLKDHAEFVKSMIDQCVIGGDVVLFGNAFPIAIHHAFSFLVENAFAIAWKARFQSCT